MRSAVAVRGWSEAERLERAARPSASGSRSCRRSGGIRSPNARPDYPPTGEQKQRRFGARHVGHARYVELTWVLFDLNGTLLDPSGIGEPVGLSPEESIGALDE